MENDLFPYMDVARLILEVCVPNNRVRATAEYPTQHWSLRGRSSLGRPLRQPVLVACGP